MALSPAQKLFSDACAYDGGKIVYSNRRLGLGELSEASQQADSAVLAVPQRTAPFWQCHRGLLLASRGYLEYSSYWLRHTFGDKSPGRPDPNGKLAVRP